MEALQGEDNKGQVGVTDNYGAYKNSFTDHQLCWAHPIRKVRDLKNSDQIGEKKRVYAQEVYESLCGLHERLEQAIAERFCLEKRRQHKGVLLKELVNLCKAKKGEPIKLKKIKKSLEKNQEKYFTCLLHKGIPTTNNKAERALRHVVLKRKISNGTKTEKGANVMSVLFSTVLSLWWRKPKHFFHEYAILLSPP